MRIYSFPPIVDNKSKILILGTMPSNESLRLNQYYAHSRNSFWKILFTLFDKPYSDNYETRKSLLLENCIAVWDTLKACERQTSADADIQTPEPNNFKVFLEEHPLITTVFCNGRDAEAFFNKYWGDLDVEMIYLPSTSPANAINWEKKLIVWKKIMKYVI